MTNNTKRGAARILDDAPPTTLNRFDENHGHDTSASRRGARMSDFETLARAIDAVIPGANYGPLAGKRPLTARGFHDFLTLADDGFAELAAAADADRRTSGIGYRLPTGFVGFDVDNKGDAIDRYNRFVQVYDLPTTTAVRSGSGGWHIIFRLPRGWTRPLRAAAESGIDVVRAHDSGYLVGPGSLHESGARYAFVGDARPAELPIAAAEFLAAPRRRSSPTQVDGRAAAQVDSDDVATWLAAHGAGTPDAAMRRCIARVEQKMQVNGIHEVARTVLWEAIHLAAEGHPGAQRACGRVLAAATAENHRREASGAPGARAPQELLAEFGRLIAGAVADVVEVAE